MKRKILPITFTACVFITGLLILISFRALWNQAVDPLAALPRSYQAVVLAGMGLVSLATLLSLTALIIFIGSDASRGLWLKLGRLMDYFKKPAYRTLLYAILAGFAIISGQMLLQISTTKNALATQFLTLNRPFFIWLILFSLISLAGFLIWTKDFKRYRQPMYLYPLLLSISMMLILLALNFSGVGFQKDAPGTGSFRLTGFPLLDYQLLLTWIVITAVFFSAAWLWSKYGIARRVSPQIIDLILAVAIFLFAFWVWEGAPIIPNAFVDKPRPPNFQYYPNLDSLVYDRTALNLLASGEMQTYIQIPEQDNVGRRPLFTMYLVGLHVLAGNDYQKLLQIQIGIFALLPALIYLFTKSIFNRFSGVLAAVLLVIRNLNGVWLEEDVWGGTTLHMLMSDILTSMIVIFFLYLAAGWMRDSKKSGVHCLILGAVIGLGMLVRQELVLLLFAVCFTALIYFRRQLAMILRKLIVVAVGMVVVIMPWFVRNALVTGKVFLDKPGKVTTLLMNTFHPGYEAESSGNDINLEGDIHSLQTSDQNVNQSGVENPGPIRLIGNHVTSAVPQVFLYLPSNPVWLEADFLYRLITNDLGKIYGGFFYSPYSYAKSLPYWWWDKWDGKIANKSWIYLGVNVILISIGLYQAWKKRWDGVLLSIFTLAGMISVYALIRRSGGRFIQPVDWISLVFLSIGLVQITLTTGKQWLGINLKDNSQVDHPLEKSLGVNHHKVAGWLLFLLIFLIGCSPILAEIVIPNHYPDSAGEARLDQLLEGDLAGFDQEQIRLLNEFLLQGGEVLYGQAFYPRYFPPDAALMTTNESLFPSSTTFTVAGPEMDFVVLSRLESPEWFPQGTETLVIGCRESSYPDDPGFACLGCGTNEFEALVVVLFHPDNAGLDVLWRDGNYSQAPSCPLH
jgi:hypothetical protein